MENLWKRINSIVPDPKCRTKNNEIISWDDERDQPSNADLLSVNIDAIEQDEIKKQKDITDNLQKISGKTHSQLDKYLDDNSVDNPAIRTLFHVQLALLHKLCIK